MSKVLKTTYALFALLILASCIGAQNPPMTDISATSLAQNDSKAIILLKAGNPNLDYYLDIQKFDEDKKEIFTEFKNSTATSLLMGGLLGATLRPEISAALSTKTESIQGYIAREVDPGTYAFSFFSQQGLWAACFNHNTFSFDVKPGEVLYLGELAYHEHFDEILMIAKENGDEISRNNEIYSYFDNISPPRFVADKSKETSGLEAAKVFIQENAPNVSSEINLAQYRKTDFTTRSNLMLSGQILCRSKLAPKN